MYCNRVRYRFMIREIILFHRQDVQLCLQPSVEDAGRRLIGGWERASCPARLFNKQKRNNNKKRITT